MFSFTGGRSNALNVCVYCVIALLVANKLRLKFWPRDECGGQAYFEDRQPPADAEHKFLIGRLTALSKGYQLGNQIFEILGFEAVAQMLGRTPVIVLNDEFNEQTKHQMWSALTHFPHVFDRYQFWRVPGFNFSDYPSTTLHSLYNTVFNLTELQEMDDEPTVAVHASYFENYRYLDILGQRAVKARLQFPPSATEFVKDIVPKEYHIRKNRLCVHMRRGDYVFNPALFASNSSYTLNAIKYITSEGNNFAVTIFTDDVPYAEEMIESAEYKSLNVLTFMPRNGNKLHPLPKHYSWLFMSKYCSHFLLTAGRSTFAFFGVYLADKERIKVFYNPYHREPQNYDLPPNWTPLETFRK